MHQPKCTCLWLAAPERVSLRMEGGVKTTELSSVPNRLLLGVSEMDEKLVNEVDDSRTKSGSFGDVPV